MLNDAGQDMGAGRFMPLAEPEPAPPWAREAACLLASHHLEGCPFDLATIPIPVHRLRPGSGVTGWAPSLPLVAWAFAAFMHDEVACLAVVGFPGQDSHGEVRPAGPDTELGEGLAMAAGLVRAAASPALLRLVEIPGADVAFWVDWGQDTFVALAPPRVLSGPAFAALARTAAEGEFADLARAAAPGPDDEEG